MSLFALYCLLDDHDVYRTKMQRSCSTAPWRLWKSLGWTRWSPTRRAGYYSVIDRKESGPRACTVPTSSRG